MNHQDENEVKRSPNSADLEAIAAVVWQSAQSRQGDGLALLALLRQLEKLHREIRDGLFQECLPDNRQALYSMLRDMEASGGWPYIHRMKLQSFMQQLLTELADGENSAEHESSINQ
ncbi:hypothetical protein H6G89_00965 [Oscillatoria sp. FACHB-1407]|uniref:hypothetical protein n=1 Tax=Oscillatoria sp. FACHB-1407 TaxID=2692847 RepID=UPI0016888E18|nr:hypothetical protein [Oscillatoria sp. FACHB-1407]MBD2459601.1 hypothetical protein [Oscillatoria sp. FACHB-1407]